MELFESCLSNRVCGIMFDGQKCWLGIMHSDLSTSETSMPLCSKYLSS